MPLVWGMEPLKGFTLLLGCHAVIYTGGSLTAVLLNIPGSAGNAATMLDGFPMTQQGKAGRAIGAALTASMLGGILGALILFISIPIVRPIVMAFGSPETFFLAFLGISFVAALSRESMLKG